MKKMIAFSIAFMLLFLVSCSFDPATAWNPDPSDGADTTDTEGAFAADIDLSVRAFTILMYEQALPPLQNNNNLTPSAPGALVPVEELPRVGDGVVGSTVRLSLTDSPNDLFWLWREPSDGAGTTVTIVTANGDATEAGGVESQFQPLCVVVDVTTDDGRCFLANPETVEGVIRSVCFLDGNEYWFVNNGSAAVTANTETADAEGGAIFGGVRVGGELWQAPHDGQNAAESLQGVYERIYTRFVMDMP